MACVAPEGALQRLVAVAAVGHAAAGGVHEGGDTVDVRVVGEDAGLVEGLGDVAGNGRGAVHRGEDADVVARAGAPVRTAEIGRATSELQSLMRISYAVFCLKKKKHNNNRLV